jgi:hypothetical protein
MEVMRLASNWRGDILIEDYTSMIWTERFDTHGDFELKTPNIESTLKRLPEYSLITLRDTLEVMVVESHEITVDAEGQYELTVRGRTFDSFLKHRAMIGGRYWTGTKSWSLRKKYTAGEAAAAVIYNHIIDNDPWFLRQDWFTAGGDTPPPEKGNPKDLIENIRVNTVSGGTKRFRQISLGPVYNQVQNLIKEADFGIRTIRPTGIVQDLIRFDAEGVPEYYTQTLSASMTLDIYKGLDRSVDQSTRKQVVFRYDAGHITDPSYLFNQQGVSNVVIVDNDDEVPYTYFRVGTPTTVSGLDRRVGYTTVNIKNTDVVELTDPYAAQEQAGERFFKKQPKTRIFEFGSVSPDLPFQYKRDYNLGDTVTLQAEYGFSRSMQVTEYIRTHTVEGEEGYPTLSASD